MKNPLLPQIDRKVPNYTYFPKISKKYHQIQKWTVIVVNVGEVVTVGKLDNLSDVFLWWILTLIKVFIFSHLVLTIYSNI